MTTAEDILAFIEANPDDDTGRLAYADFLEEGGYSPRAELIRVQCGLERRKLFLESRENTIESNRLLVREWQLLTQHAAEFRRGPQCEACEGTGRINFGLADGDCKACHGAGDVGGLMRRRAAYGHEKEYPETWLHTVDFVRGFPRVRCRMEECVQEERYTYGLEETEADDTRTIPTDWLLSVVRHHRGVEVWVTDLEIIAEEVVESKRLRRRSSVTKSWDCYSTLLSSSGVPEPIFNLIKSEHPDWTTTGGQGIEFESEVEARTVVAQAIPAWARGHLK